MEQPLKSPPFPIPPSYVADLFDKLDTNKDGVLSPAEISVLFRMARIPPPSRAQLSKFFDTIDANHDGVVSREELQKYITERQKLLYDLFLDICDMESCREKTSNDFAPKEFTMLRELKAPRAAFTARTLRTAAQFAGVNNVSDADIRSMIDRFDLNHDNVVTFGEFCECLLLVPDVNPRAFFDTCFSRIPSSGASDFESPASSAEHLFSSLFFSSFSSSSTIRKRTPTAAGNKDDDGHNDDNNEEGAAMRRAIVVKKIICSGIAGCVSKTLTAPIDLVRIQVMTDESFSSSSSVSSSLKKASSHQQHEQQQQRRPLTVWQCVRQTMKGPGGIRAFWTGNVVNSGKAFPELALKLVTFDLMRKQIARDPDCVTLTERLVAGGVAGAFAQSFVMPVDTVRTRMIVGAAAEAASQHHHTNNSSSKGFFSYLRFIVKREGPRALFAGMAPSIAGIVPYAAIDLTLNDLLKEAAARHLTARGQERCSVSLLLACGTVSSTVAVVLTFPLYVVRTRAQATGEAARVVLKRLMRNEGWRGLFRGVGPTVAKVAPSTAVSYAAYDSLCSWWDG